MVSVVAVPAEVVVGVAAVPGVLARRRNVRASPVTCYPPLTCARNDQTRGAGLVRKLED